MYNISFVGLLGVTLGQVGAVSQPESLLNTLAAQGVMGVITAISIYGLYKVYSDQKTLSENILNRHLEALTKVLESQNEVKEKVEKVSDIVQQCKKGG
jgi:hypothetical protein